MIKLRVLRLLIWVLWTILTLMLAVLSFRVPYQYVPYWVIIALIILGLSTWFVTWIDKKFDEEVDKEQE